MEEWQKHVKDTHADNAGKAWCGAHISNREWVFQDVDHVAQSGRYGSRVQPCPACLQAILAALVPTVG